MSSGISNSEDTMRRRRTYPPGASSRIFIVSYAFIVILSLNACSTRTEPPKLYTDPLPALGDSRTHVHQLLNGKLDGDEMGLGYWRVHIVDQFVHLHILYSKTRDGVPHVMQLNFHHADALSGSARDEIRRRYVGPDYRELHNAEMPSMIQNDVASPSPGEDTAVFESPSLGKRIRRNTYWMQPGGGWRSGVCPNTRPGIVEIYHEESEGRLTRLGVFSAYLDHCQYKVLS